MLLKGEEAWSRRPSWGKIGIDAYDSIGTGRIIGTTYRLPNLLFPLPLFLVRSWEGQLVLYTYIL